MIKQLLLIISLVCMSMTLNFADTNGVWTYPQDIKPGVFGEDESTNYSESYTFNHKIIGSYYYDIKDPNYILNLSGVSNMYRIVADLYFSSGNTAYYLNPAGYSNVNTLNARQLQLRGTDIESMFATKDEGSSMPKGMVVAFNLNSCPSGWIEADGNDNTPDLRGTFVRGMNGDENGRDVSRSLRNYQESSYIYNDGGGPSHPNHDYNVRNGDGNKNMYAKAYSHHWSDISGTKRYTSVRPENVALLYCVKT